MSTYGDVTEFLVTVQNILAIFRKKWRGGAVPPPRSLQLHQGCGIFTGTYYAAHVLQHVYIVEHQLLLWQLREVPSDATAPVRYHTPADGHLPTRCIAQPRGGATVSLVCVIICFAR